MTGIYAYVEEPINIEMTYPIPNFPLSLQIKAFVSGPDSHTYLKDFLSYIYVWLILFDIKSYK